MGVPWQQCRWSPLKTEKTARIYITLEAVHLVKYAILQSSYSITKHTHLVIALKIQFIGLIFMLYNKIAKHFKSLTSWRRGL